MGKAVGNYFKGMFIGSTLPTTPVTEAPSQSVPTVEEKEEQETLVINAEEDDLFLSECSEGEELDEEKQLEIQGRNSKREKLKLRIKNYLQK